LSLKNVVKDQHLHTSVAVSGAVPICSWRVLEQRQQIETR